MKTSIRNKKGFTIVELVIVIAVIAILAAVLIPTFADLVEKANQSADEQACRQMNTALAIEINAPTDVAKAKIILAKSGYDADNYKPLTSGCDFYWISDINRVVLVDDEDAVTFPKEYADKTYDSTTWKSLSGIGDEAKVDKLVNAFGGSEKLSGTYDLKGGCINLTVPANTTQVTYGGTDTSSATIENAVSDKGTFLNIKNAGTENENAWTYNAYNAGIISTVPENTTVTVENLVIKGMVIGDTSQPNAAYAGVIAGSVEGTLIIKNITIEDCVVFGEYDIGALVGYVGSEANITVKDVTVKNTKVQGCAWVAKLFGLVENGATITYSGNNDFNGITVEPSEYNFTVPGYDTTKIQTKNNGDKYIYDGKRYSPYLTNESAWVHNMETDVLGTATSEGITRRAE